MIQSKSNGFGYPIVAQIPRVKNPIPLFIVFRALGVISDEEICHYILLNLESKENQSMCDSLQASIIDANTCLTQEECIKYITTHVMYTPMNMDKETF